MPTSTAAQKHGYRKWAYARRMLYEHSAPLSLPALRRICAEADTYLCVSGDSNRLATDGFPIDSWPVSVKRENYKHYSQHSRELTPEEWYAVLTARGWTPFHSTDTVTFIFAKQTGPAIDEIEAFRRYPYDPLHPLISLRTRRRTQ